MNSGRGPVPRRILTISELTRLLKTHLEEGFADVWVEGEVGGIRMPGSGHLYFTLKDAQCQIKAIVFRSHARFLRCMPKEGQWVCIRGHLSLYEARGEYQLAVDYLEPKGAGALQAAFEALKARLAAEGLFEAARKRPLPPFPQKIGLITSPSGAAVRDILRIVRDRAWRVSILIAPVSVQGPGAAEEITRALRQLGERGDLEVLILARGGGSLEDLSAFNDEGVARAIAGSPIPVVSAVGHETDYTVSDFVADLRAPTPSAAAEQVVPDRSILLETVGRLREELHNRMGERLGGIRRHLQAETRLLQGPEKRVAEALRRVDDLTERLYQRMPRLVRERRWAFERADRRLDHLNPLIRLYQWRERFLLYQSFMQKGLPTLDRHRARLQEAVAALSALSPLAILARGYSIVRRWPKGEIIRDAGRLRPEERLHLRLHRGEAECRVERIMETDGERENSLEIS